KGTNVKAIQDIVGLYSYQTGIDVAGIASNLLSNYRGIGLTGTGAIQAVIQPMMQQMTSRFAYGSIDQVMNTFLSMFQKQIGLTGGDVNTAYQQSLALMKGLGKDFGLNEMLQLQNLYLGPGRTNELIKRGVVIPGVDLQQVQQVQGGPGGLINTIDLIQQSARSLVLQNAPQLRGTNLQESLQGKTYTDVFTTLSGRKIFETFVEMIGITPEFALSLARMKDINTNIKDIVGSMENLNISTDKFIETVSSNVTTKAIERSADLSTSLLDTISNWMLERRTDVGKIAADLGIEPSVIEGAGASLLVGTVLWSFLKKWGIYRGATKKPRMMGGMALPVIGAMDIMREAHEGGDMGQGLMNVATDVATFSLMSKIFGGGKHTGDIPKTATKATRLGRFAKFGRFGLPVIAGGIVLNQLLETSRPVEEAPVPEYAKIYGEEEEPSLEDLVPLSKYLEAIQYRDKRKKLYDKEKKSYIREGVSSKDTENEPLLMYNSRGELERGREKSYFKGGMSSENLEDVLNRGKLENSIENISALSKRTMNEGLKRKAKETGIPEMLDKGDFGTLNIVVTTPDGETIASEAMKQGETKRIMINLKGVLA
ncbi:MAG: hypothetical protein M0Q88_07080, partial [Bacilli bacterium]|nr:hypothetical protein [Bacilli bacterium]